MAKPAYSYVPTLPKVTKPPTPKPVATNGNKGGAVRGQARAVQVQARNAARKLAKGKTPKPTKPMNTKTGGTD